MAKNGYWQRIVEEPNRKQVFLANWLSSVRYNQVGWKPKCKKIYVETTTSNRMSNCRFSQKDPTFCRTTNDLHIGQQSRLRRSYLYSYFIIDQNLPDPRISRRSICNNALFF